MGVVMDIGMTAAMSLLDINENKENLVPNSNWRMKGLKQAYKLSINKALNLQYNEELLTGQVDRAKLQGQSWIEQVLEQAQQNCQDVFVDSSQYQDLNQRFQELDAKNNLTSKRQEMQQPDEVLDKWVKQIKRSEVQALTAILQQEKERTMKIQDGYNIVLQQLFQIKKTFLQSNILYQKL
eukprot:TRINITY_DN1266_c0_g2_i1.p1 TRINITY_DN1266_c0_g2~~TRINITY_DN1266_c0_g2_i1.p1  ORF type:complete len:188 (-),score=26.41 TRINITY_DN1266_c0_g2_i1:340-882(-)